MHLRTLNISSVALLSWQHISLTKPFVLQVDASYVGAGAVLLQADKKGVERPVGFYSRKYSYQLNYLVIQKETLALVWGLQHFDVYVGSGAHLVVYTDHNPLTILPCKGL